MMLFTLIGVAITTLLISLVFVFLVNLIKTTYDKTKKKETNIIHDYSKHEKAPLIANRIDKAPK